MKSKRYYQWNMEVNDLLNKNELMPVERLHDLEAVGHVQLFLHH